MPNGTCGPECEFCNYEYNVPETTTQTTWTSLTERWVDLSQSPYDSESARCKGTCGALLCESCMQDVKKALSF